MNRLQTPWLLLLALGLAAPAGARRYFSDVPPTHWAARAVNELAALGILNGYPAAPVPRKPPKPPARERANRKPSTLPVGGAQHKER